MKIPSLNPQEAQAKLSQGATLIDIRSADEYAHKHITGAVSKPLDGLQGQTLNDGVIIFSCLGGVRTEQNAPLLKNCASGCQEWGLFLLHLLKLTSWISAYNPF